VDRPGPSAGPRHGRVASFDQTRGLGTVEDDTGQAVPFHATAIADGRRRIDVGAEVTFTVAPGHGGRVEARSVVPTTSPAGGTPGR
jgi:cold shock CspA family protein